MKKKYIFLFFLILVGCSSTMKRENFFWDDLSLSLKIGGNKANLYGYLTCKNISKKIVSIPEFYINLNNTENGLLKNDWLIIYDDNKNRIPYQGAYYDPSPKYLKEQTIKLPPNEIIEIKIQNINRNYNISKYKKIFISYDGPLGKSNEIEYIP